MSSSPSPQITPFFEADSCTFTYLVSCPATLACAVIDPVLNFDMASGATSTSSIDAVIQEIKRQNLHLEWILETHMHADHLSAAAYLQQQAGGKTAIGAAITQVQQTFADLFNVEASFARDGSQFNLLLTDGAVLNVGNLQFEVMHTPGHTPACVTYLVADAAFVGDTLFMPDFGTARCDFPGGDAKVLYESIHKILSLAPSTRLFMCHDYLTSERQEYKYLSSVAAQLAENIHLKAVNNAQEFVALRQERDAQLAMPKLILPAVQVNMRGGQFPPAEANGISYLKLPLNQI